MAKRRTLGIGLGQPKEYHSCTVMRRKLVKTGTLSMATGQLEMSGKAEWVTEACGTPLFGDEERRSGTCRSCAKGWTHPENYPVESDNG